MESSSSTDEPYIDSFFLPEGILDSEDDDVNARLQLTKDDEVKGVGGGDGDALTPVAELMPSFLGISKVTWTAPPLLIPSQTADDIVIFYHSAADDLESRSSTHSPTLKALPSPLLSAPQREDDDHCSDEFRDCISHEKSTESASSLRVTSPVFTPVADRIASEGRASVPASPPPGFDSNKCLGSPNNKDSDSPKAVALPARNRSGPGSGAVVEATARQRSPVPSTHSPKKTASISGQPPPQRREATRGSNRKQSYASVLVAKAKKAGARDGMVRQQVPSAPPSFHVVAPLYATPPRTNGGISIQSADRRHRSFAPTSAAGGTERSQSVDGTRPTGEDASTPSKAVRQRNQRRQRKPKASTRQDHPANDGCGERESLNPLHLQPQQPISNDSSTSSSSLSSSLADSSLSSSHTDVDESESKGEHRLLSSNGHEFSARDEPSRDSDGTEPLPDSGRPAVNSALDPPMQAAVKHTKRSLLRTNAFSLATLGTPFISTWEVMLPFLLGCVSLVGFIFAEAAKVLILLTLGVAATCRYAAHEIQCGGAGATGSYAAFLLLPASCDLMMSSFSLPHFTPHFVSTVAICQLCQPSSPRKVYTAASSGFLAMDDPLAEDVSHWVLRLARYALLVAEVFEGFSRSNMSYMVAGVPARAMIAYVLSLARSNLLLSPVGWASASVQWLLASYACGDGGGGICSVVTAAALVLIGMASVQLSRRVQPSEADGDDSILAHRRSASGDEARHGVRSGPGKRPSVRV